MSWPQNPPKQRPDISADWTPADWQQAREDLASGSASEPQAGQTAAWNWFDPEGRPAAWRAFGE